MSCDNNGLRRAHSPLLRVFTPVLSCCHMTWSFYNTEKQCSELVWGSRKKRGLYTTSYSRAVDDVAALLAVVRTIGTTWSWICLSCLPLGGVGCTQRCLPTVHSAVHGVRRDQLDVEQSLGLQHLHHMYRPRGLLIPPVHFRAFHR